jgi:dTDP-4-dehydrorhamnose reductase
MTQSPRPRKNTNTMLRSLRRDGHLEALGGSRLLITGASGLLGINLVRTACAQGHTVVTACHRHPIEVPGVLSLLANLTSSVELKELVSQAEPDWIIHCAALTDVDYCQTHEAEAFLVNEELPGQLAIAARQCGAGLVHISTDAVFDGRRGNYSERDSSSPVNTYASSKWKGEEAVKRELENAAILRVNLYGWNTQEKLSLAEWVLTRLESGRAVPGFQDVVFTPILANDLGEIILQIIQNELSGIYHVAGSQCCSKYDFAVQLARVFGLDESLVKAVSIDDFPLHAPRPKNTSLNTQKISHVLGRAMPDLQAGLQRYKALRDSGEVQKLKQFARSQSTCLR